MSTLTATSAATMNVSYSVTTDDPVMNSTEPWTPVYPDPEKCNYYILNHNTTKYFQFSNPYGGIPQVENKLFSIFLVNDFWPSPPPINFVHASHI